MSTRTEFLAALAGTAAGARAASPAKRTTQPVAKRPEWPPPFDFDRARFQAILQKPAPHKQCFGAKEIDGGAVLDGMNNSIDAYENFLHEGRGAMQAVAVLYHGGSALMGLNDAFWDDVLVEYVKRKGPYYKKMSENVAPGKGNPYLHSTTQDPDDVSIESLAAKGSRFFLCHNLLSGVAGLLAHTLHVPRAKMHARIMAAVVPAAMVVPAGVMAINACQEAKFTYIAT